LSSDVVFEVRPLRGCVFEAVKNFELKVLKEVWEREPERLPRVRGYVAVLRWLDNQIVLRKAFLSDLLHELGHVLLALTNELHHGGFEE